MDFLIGVFAIGAGFTAKNVISFPPECISEEVVREFVIPKRTTMDLNNF